MQEIVSALNSKCIFYAGNGVIEFDEFVDLMSRRGRGQQGTAAELSSAFTVLDHENDGYIDAAEFRHVMTTMGEPLNDEQMDEMMRQFCPDGDGKVAFQGERRVLFVLA